MRVKATRKGFYNDRLMKAGDEFVLNKPEDLSDADRRATYGIGWMKVIEATDEERALAAAAEKKRREGGQTIAKTAPVLPPPEGVDRGDPSKRDNIAGARIVTDRRPDGSSPAKRQDGSAAGDGSKKDEKPAAAEKSGTGNKDVLS